MLLACFVILHYRTSKETMRCVDSLLNLRGIDSCMILIYDNGSQDGSGELLKAKYSTNKRIKVIIDRERNGFSRGNNKAYQIARKFSVKYLILSNNDIVIKDKKFLSKLNQIDENMFQVVGPDIYAPMVSEHQSPLYPVYPELNSVEKDVKIYKERLSDLNYTVEWEKRRLKKNCIKKYIPSFIISMIRLIVGNKKSNDWNNKIINPVLFGAFLIFTKSFVNDNNEVFAPETQFYYEELILAERCRRLQYNTLYSPELSVEHMHGQSTMKTYEELSDYVRFKYTNLIDSFNIYKEYRERP